MNPAIWAAFLCVHHCPFRHTCGIYPDDLQNTWLATTSNDEQGQEGNKIAPPVTEKVHWGVNVHFCYVREGAPRMIPRQGQYQDTPLVYCQPWEEISLSVIGKWKNQPKHRVAIHRTIVQKRRWDPWCLPTVTRNMLATIYEPSMLQKHPMKCISPQESSVVLALSQSTQDQWGVNCTSVSEQQDFHRLVSILTIAL